MILDRKKPPKVYQIEDVSLANILSEKVNGINTYAHIDQGSKTFKIELQSKGSQLYGTTAALPQLALRMLNEGTKYKTSAQLAEAIDALGSFIEISPGFDYSSITIYGLSKYFTENIQLLSEILYEPLFSEESLNTLKTKEIDRLKLNLEKGSYISSINLRKSLFGNTHPYGSHLNSEDIQQTDINTIQSFHNTFTKDFDLYVSGDLPEEFSKVIRNHFHQIEHRVPSKRITPLAHAAEHLFHKDSKLIQSSIKVGKRLFTRNHEDYFPFILTNEILGGFFGSRLMKNIREDKGYTYGIHSNLYALLHDGYFLISTDVKGENQQDTLDELFKEIELLSTELVSQQELDIVKNYMIGVFTNSFTSPFAHIDKFKTLNSQGISMDFYKTYVSNIRNITPEMIRACSTQYLTPDSLITSIAGA